MDNSIIKVVLIEDDAIIRDSYAFFINETKTYQVVNSYPSVEKALKTIKNDDPHIILLDIELPGMSGIQALPLLREQVKDVSIIILTVYEHEKTVFDALSQGAIGYLTKDVGPEKIIEALGEAMIGGGPMSANIARMVVNSFRKNPETPLTKRETEILEQIANGKTRNQVAEEFFIDLETVKSHLKNIYAKLDVHSRADAIKMAKQNKYI